MNSHKPKYSIIIPVKNGKEYLLECINTIINQGYSDYELIISDDHSIDGTTEYLKTVNHPNIMVIQPSEEMTVTEHFNFAIHHASGEWLMTLGADDGLQPYFFSLADKLTDFAKSREIRAIASKRANYLWDGCQPVRGDTAVNYSANFRNIFKIKKSSLGIIKVLLHFDNGASYHSLPTMYTTSLFHSTLIKDAIEKNNGKLFTFNFPDANFAALSTTIEKKYIECSVPLGWVGTSPKTIYRDDNIKNQLRKIPVQCGDYFLGDFSIYFWGALITLSYKHSRLFESKLFMTLMFSRLMQYIYRKYKTKNLSERIQNLEDIIKINNCNKILVLFLSKLWRFLDIILRFFTKVIKKVIRESDKLFKTNKNRKSISIKLLRSDNPNLSLTEASDIIIKLISNAQRMGVKTW